MSKIPTVLLTALVLIGVAQTNAVTLDDYPNTFTPDPERYADAIASFVADDQQTMPEEEAIVAVGSSTMGGWHSRIHADLYGLTIIPRGFGGSVYSDVIYFADEIILPYNPRAVLVYEGDNDISGGKSPETILSDLQFLVDYCRTTLPELRFYIIGIKPSIARWSLWPQMVEANSLMEAYCNATDGMLYIDVSSTLLTEDGSTIQEYYRDDNLHLSPAGYDAWADAIAPVMLAKEIEYEDEIPCDHCENSPEAIYIDFGVANSEPGWNSFTDANASGPAVDLINGKGEPTGVSLVTLTEWNGTDTDGYSRGIGSLIPEATSDSIYGSTGNYKGGSAPNPILQLDGLDPETRYRFVVYASKNGGSSDRSALYTATGANSVSGSLNAAANQFHSITLEGVLPDPNGTVLFDFKEAEENVSFFGEFYLGAMIIEVEEPLSWGGYPVVDDLVDTGTFMGWLGLSADPAWTYSYSLEKWAYFPAEPDENGAWVYILK